MVKIRAIKYKIVILSIGIFFTSNAYSLVKQDLVTLEPFGEVHLYIPEKTVESVTIMISGDGGWKYGVPGFAEHFAGKNSLVIGVDILKYYKNLRSRKEDCYHIVRDFITLVNIIEKKFNFPQYREPILMGFSSGATMVYALLAQARPDTFKGGISLGFCPEVDLPKHFCELNGLKQHPVINGKVFDLNPDSHLGNKWIVLQGKLDNECSFKSTADFVHQSVGGEIIELDNVGHGFSKWIDFMPQWDNAFTSIIVQNKQASPNNKNVEQVEKNKDLPIVVTNAKINNENTPLVLFISGDGGWYSFEQNLSDRMSDMGIPTIGLDAKNYFWNRRTPIEAAQDLTTLLNFYLESLHKNKILLIGYSMGAEVMPFIFKQFPKEMQEKIEKMILLSPDSKTDFEIHITNMLGFGNHQNTYDVVEELKMISSDVSILIITGDAENSTLSSNLSATDINFGTVPGDHHYNNNSLEILKILKGKGAIK